MPDDFFHLDASDRRAILNDAAQRLGRIPRVLEKDVWVCWALNHLFSIQDRRQMAFKGGTSLSKVYGVIDRFSEDVDVTVDFQESAPGGEPNRSGEMYPANPPLFSDVLSAMADLESEINKAVMEHQSDD